jgi:hypothetical protein
VRRQRRHRPPGGDVNHLRAPGPHPPVRRGRHPLREGHRPGPLPLRSFAINTAWLTFGTFAVGLICSTQHLLLHGELGEGRAEDPCATGFCTSPPAWPSLARGRHCWQATTRVVVCTRALTTAFAQLVSQNEQSFTL